jgi:RNA polymerase sigma-70 factor (ECF subfamily)
VFAVARNILRRTWRQQPREGACREAEVELLCPRPLPETAIEHREELARVLKALDELDLQTRDVFVLRFIEQMPLAEVAAVMGEPLGTVKSRVHRGRERLAILLRSVNQT